MENAIKYNERQWTFNDGEKTIDYVLVWVESSDEDTSTEKVETRTTFEANLMEQGLELEHEFNQGSGFHFIKIHAALETLQRYAEILKLRMPLKDISNTEIKKGNFIGNPFKSSEKSFFKKAFKCFEIPHAFPDCSHELTSTYIRTHNYLFDIKSPGFFTPAHKARIIQFIMERTLYTKDGISDTFGFGIHRLVMHGVYAAAYPLHDGDLNTPGSMRYLFYNYWASFNNWYKNQPTDNIRQYFGVRTALYFVWLGYYTQMLIPASIIGVACFIASLLLSPGDDPTDDVCDGKIGGVLCPSCDYHCNFVSVADTCIHSKVLFIFDNATTVFFAIFISFWAAVFLECWKRYSAEITLRWDLTWLDDQDENPRPEYAARLSKIAVSDKLSHTLNFITNAMEPSVTFWKHVFPGEVLSIITILFLVTLAVAAVIGVVIVHMIALATPTVSPISSIAATCLNLVCILIFSPIYTKVAAVMTELELPRTQQQYDKSLYLKLYLLEFINHYASIFYIAFFKGKFVGPPTGYYRIFGFRQLECGAGGCMLELTKQLAIIMIGKRAFKSFVQILRPKFKHLWRRRSSPIRDGLSQWEKDFLLCEEGPGMLFPEYLDMVLQYGFVTIFVSAFPLAPLFALITNIFEIRIDARKIVMYRRRSAMRRVKDIGVWFDILKYISKLAVFTNAFIVAFTSNFIPKLVYRLSVSPDLGLAGYINNTLSYIAIQDLDMNVKPNTTEEYCKYFDYREPPWSKDKYEETMMFWKVLASRLAFFLIFENMILTAVDVLSWFIPDVPRQVEWKMRRRHYLVNEAIICQEVSDKGTKTSLKHP